MKLLMGGHKKDSKVSIYGMGLNDAFCAYIEYIFVSSIFVWRTSGQVFKDGKLVHIDFNIHILRILHHVRIRHSHMHYMCRNSYGIQKKIYIPKGECIWLTSMYTCMTSCTQYYLSDVFVLQDPPEFEFTLSKVFPVIKLPSQQENVEQEFQSNFVKLLKVVCMCTAAATQFVHTE